MPSTDHTIRLLSPDEIRRRRRPDDDEAQLRAQAIAAGADPEVVAAAKSFGSCETGKCRTLALYVTSYRYVHGRSSIAPPTKRDQDACQVHAESFAKRHGIDMSPAEPPVGHIVTDARGERWEHQFDGWSLRYGAGKGSWAGVLGYSILPLTVTAPPDPAELRRQADVLESRECTGLTASYCPVHGDCGCPRDGDGRAESLDAPRCPLHSPASAHAAATA